MKTKFEIGDKVEAFGFEGTVSGINKNDTYAVTVQFTNGKSSSFTRDGRFYDWHNEPSLKLIEKAKKKVTKEVVLYRYTVKLEENILQSVWTSDSCEYHFKGHYMSPYEVLKTETKTVAYEVEE